VTEVLEQKVNAAERFILSNYQHLMSAPERMLARSLVAADFDVKKIPRSVWNRAWSEFPGMDRSSRWKLPFLLCSRVLNQHRDQIRIPDEVKSR
jgi:hypothetical protein